MLKKVLTGFVNAAVNIGRRQAEKIKNPLLLRLVLVIVNAGEDLIKVLLDEDKDNEAQLKDLAYKHAAVVIGEGAILGREKLAQLKDPTLAANLVLIVNGAEEVLKALVDDNQDNETQLLAIWNSYKKKLIGEGVDLATDKVAELVRKKVKDANLAAIIIGILEDLDRLVKEPEPQPAAPVTNRIFNPLATVSAPANTDLKN